LYTSSILDPDDDDGDDDDDDDEEEEEEDVFVHSKNDSPQVIIHDSLS
jgi:hypothetical protein